MADSASVCRIVSFFVGALESVSDGCVGPDAVGSSAGITIVSTAAFCFTCPACCTPSSQKANISDGLSCYLVALPSGSAFCKPSSVTILVAGVRVGRGVTVVAEAIAAASYKHNIINFNQ